MQTVQRSETGLSRPRTQLNFETSEGTAVLHNGWGRTRAHEETSNEGKHRLVTIVENAESFAECENKNGRGPGYLQGANYPARPLFKTRIASNVLHQGFRWSGNLKSRGSCFVHACIIRANSGRMTLRGDSHRRGGLPLYRHLRACYVVEDFHISEISTSKNRSGVVDPMCGQRYKRFANAFNHPGLK
jgi:hypothetical protein